MNCFRTKPNQSRTRGLTLLEVMMAVALLSAVFLSVAFISSETAKQTLSLYGDARTLRRAHLAMERVRYILAQGQAFSGVVKDDGRTFEFRNPNMPAGITSSFSFHDGKLFYRSDKNSGPVAPLQGIGLIEDVVFDVETTNTVRVTVTTRQRYSWKLSKPFRLQTEITLRNIP